MPRRTELGVSERGDFSPILKEKNVRMSTPFRYDAAIPSGGLKYGVHAAAVSIRKEPGSR